MSTVIYYKCDHCAKERISSDGMLSIGAFILWECREIGVDAIIDIKSERGSDVGRHFCGTRCLYAWIGSKIEKFGYCDRKAKKGKE